METCSFDKNEKEIFASELLSWYRREKRSLPWRGDCVGGKIVARTPYGVWVSEVMLQQTKVATVIEYWQRWMERFPTLNALALASPDDVNLAWQGLGFYRRAKNLHEGAKEVVSKYGGELPSSVDSLKSISGIGPYTAGAISSIAFGAHEALVDGNVVRVLSRLRGLAFDAKSPALNKTSWRLARSIIPPPPDTGDFNEGLMELGATVCTPLSPNCGTCPVRKLCEGYRQGEAATTSSEIPVSSTTSASNIRGGKVQSKLSFYTSRNPSSAAQQNMEEPPPTPDIGEVGRWVAARFPAKSLPKSETRHESLSVVVIEYRGELSQSSRSSKYLLLRSDSRAQGCGSGGGKLLHGQWAPIAIQEDSINDDEESEVRGVVEETTNKSALSGDLSKAAPEKKRKREGSDCNSAQEKCLESSVALVLGLSEGLLVKKEKTESLGDSHIDEEKGLFKVQAVGAPVALSHVFSHLTHKLTVHRWVLTSGDASDLIKNLPEGVEGRWEGIEGLVGGIGMTSWTAKVFFGALAGDKDLKREATDWAPWRELLARWKKAGLIKVV